jgi:hypothetical protein
MYVNNNQTLKIQMKMRRKMDNKEYASKPNTNINPKEAKTATETPVLKLQLLLPSIRGR